MSVSETGLRAPLYAMLVVVTFILLSTARTAELTKLGSHQPVERPDFTECN
jgi:hypothetical protein